MLADLALILFIVTASYAAHDPVQGEEMVATSNTVGMEPVAQAIYQSGPEAPPLEIWLREQQLGAGATMQIIVNYQPGRYSDAIAKSERLMADALDAGLQPEVLIKAGKSEAMLVMSYNR